MISLLPLLAAYAAAQNTGPTATGTTNSPGGSPSTSYSFTLVATNPTAVPLESIVSTAQSAATSPLASAPAAGSKPSNIPNAPGLPNAASINPALYPALDKAPPLDSPQVQQWIQEVKNSGVPIPGFAPTVAGGCPANLQAAADQTRCWWTCGGCTRPNIDVTTCPDKLTWGLTYDDGPGYYTTQLLDYLDQVNLKSTFFVVGSRAVSFPAILQAEYIKGHQIAVHTWSHPALTTLSNEAIIAELGWTRKIIQDVLGVTPNMMRPPFGDIDDRVRNISIAMGLAPVMWTRISNLATFDTDDFDLHSGLSTVDKVLHNWDLIKANATGFNTGFILLEHDLFQQTVEVATGYILPDALKSSPSFNIMPVVQCLKRTAADAYIETNDNSTNPPIAGGTTTGGGNGGAALPLAVGSVSIWLSAIASLLMGALVILL